MMLTTEQYAQVQREAIEAYPREAVWHLTRIGLRQVDNISDMPEVAFEVRKADTLRSVQEGLLGVIHSHPDGPECPSEADMKSQASCGVPFGIIVSGHDSAGDYFEWGGNDCADLHERAFRHGVTDCYALVRDYYAAELHITLLDFPRGWEWWLQGENLYLDGVDAAGFVSVPLDDIQPGDMLLATLRGDAPCHAAVYIGNELILHHLTASKPYDPTRRPATEPIHRWQRHISHAFRHKDKIDE